MKLEKLIVKLGVATVMVTGATHAQTINCRVHVQNIGWMDCQHDSDGTTVGGTTGQSLRMEAVQIWAPGYHICYRAHVQNIGWMGWVCDGATAGTTGQFLGLEALNITTSNGHIGYWGHLQGVGWTGPVWDGAQIGTTGQNRRMEAIRLTLVDANHFVTGSAQAAASQTAVLRVERDIFRNGGWGFRWKRPQPYNDGCNYGDAGVTLRLGDVMPPGSTVTLARLYYTFSNLSAETGSTRPDPGFELGGDHAKAPRTHGSGSYCDQFCSPASVDHWGPDAAFWANRLQLDGQPLYWFPGPPRDATGSIDLLGVFPAPALAGHTLSFFGTVQYGVGRPFFATEGLNADTEFDVLGHAQVDVSATVVLNFTPPPPCTAPVITQQPGNVSIVSGQTTTLAVAATGCMPLSYQWLAGTTAISGANGTIYTTPALTGDATYAVRISNSVGSITSSAAHVTVQPAPALSVVRLSADTTCGTNPATGTLVLSAPALPGGLVVALSSSSPETASVQAVVMVSEGSTTAEFPITTNPVTVTTPVTITATYQNVSKAAVLQVGRDFASFSMSPSSVCGGKSTRATVSLFCPAPSAQSGVAFAISASDATTVRVPDRALVAPGSTTGSFDIATSVVGRDTETPITAALGGVRMTANLTVAGPIIDVTSQMKIVAGGFRFDHTSGLFTQSVSIQNQGSTLAGPIKFALDGVPQAVTLTNQSGVSSCSSPAELPFVAMTTGADKIFPSGATVMVILQFNNPKNLPITYTGRVLAGRQ